MLAKKYCALQRAHGALGVRTPHCVDRLFGQIDESNDAALHESCRRSRRVFDGNGGRPPMQVEQIDIFELQPT
jgi:hypothetical protein